MAQKSSGTRADKHPAKARQRAMGKPMRQRPEQTRAKPGQMERAVKDVSGNRGRNGGTVERVRIVCAADCACPGPSNAEELGYEVVEELGQLWGIRRAN